MSTAIRACLFDAGNVFITFQERADVFTRIAYAFGAPKIPTVRDLMGCGLLVDGHVGTQEGLYGLIDSGAISRHTIYAKFLQVTGLNTRQMSEPDFWALFCRHIEPIDGVAKLLGELSHAMIPLAVVSNGDLGSRHAARLISFRYGVRWTAVVVSSEVRCVKPGLAIWERAVDSVRLVIPDLNHDELLYTDDIARYCDAFKAHFPGAHAICFNGSTQPASDLRRALYELNLPVRAVGELPKTTVQPGFLI